MPVCCAEIGRNDLEDVTDRIWVRMRQEVTVKVIVVGEFGEAILATVSVACLSHCSSNYSTTKIAAAVDLS